MHTSSQFDADLEQVRSRVLQMGGLVEDQVANAVEALTTGNLSLADQVIAKDRTVNVLEKAVDEGCSRLIARHQPAAGDLRLVLMAVRTVTDLERIGDQAVTIAREARLIHLADHLIDPRFAEISRMTKLVLEMLCTSLDAIARLEAETIREVASQDLVVDAEFRSVLTRLVVIMVDDPRLISPAIEILFAAKALERMGDHVKNISRHLSYALEGQQYPPSDNRIPALLRSKKLAGWRTVNVWPGARA